MTHKYYVPCLRWKQGEYTAISKLSDSARERIVPLIAAPEIGYDFETESNSDSIDDHLAPFAQRILTYWGKKPCFVDLVHIEPGERMQNVAHPMDYVFDGLRVRGCLAVPVTGPDRDVAYHDAALNAAKQDRLGLGIRVQLEQAADPAITQKIRYLIDGHLLLKDCDLILDLGFPNFSPLGDLADLVAGVLGELMGIGQWRTVVLLGTAFPASMGSVHKGAELIDRNEWVLYTRVIQILRRSHHRIPTFGDYTINHPEVSNMDMRLVKPAATIRYAIDDHWLLIKGSNVRDNGYAQYTGHCKTVISSGHFSENLFSCGDKYISDCADGCAKTGNLTTWRWVGTNRHIEKIVSDLANLFGA